MIFPCPKPAPKFKEKRARLGARKTERRSGRERDPAYMAKVRKLPCVLLKVVGTCEGRTEVDHAGPRPLGRKCHDHECIPLCQKHHWQRTNYVGYFATYGAIDMRDWCERFIAQTRAKLNWVPKEKP